MTIVRVDKDEIYPAPYITDSRWGTEVDVPQHLLNEWEAVSARWEELAHELLTLLEAAEKKQKLIKANQTGLNSIGF